jgi:serine/tyrosine/threonine adenylyltransferase
MLNTNNPPIEWNFNNSYAMLPEHFFTRIAPTNVKQPRIIIINYPLSRELGLNLDNVSNEYLAQLFSGNLVPEGAQPLSQAYAGHQFGYFTYLGDGRAHLIGEHITPAFKRVDVQLKGSGQTLYGLRGDGRAALGPMLREYIISEAMHELGVPTTRSLAVVTTGELVSRETMLPGAILTRIASSHLRVGTFQYLLAQNDIEGLKVLAEYTINRHFLGAKQSEHPYRSFLRAVIERQVDLMVHWMRVGFIHGVMNTDNMALSGETIDYGPCAFMDSYDPKTVFSSIDSMGRYCYTNQPVIAQWNLARFAETLLPFLHENNQTAIKIAEEELYRFSLLYKEKWLTMMRAKLGLFGEHKGDDQLVSDLLNWMHQHKADYTNTFIDLSSAKVPTTPHYDDKAFQDWYGQWKQRLTQNNQTLDSSLELMRTSNPNVIPRNHKVHQALEAASQGDLTLLNLLLNALIEPYKQRSNITSYQTPPTPSERVHQTFCGT